MAIDCNRIKDYLSSFIDGELDQQMSLLVKQHLAVCPLCALELEEDKRIDSLIRANIPKEKASYKLKEAVLKKIEDSGEKKHPLVDFHLKPALVTAIAIFLITTVIFSILNIHKPFPVFTKSVNEHIQFLQGNLSIDITSNKPMEVLIFLQAKLDFKPMVPDLSSQGVRLRGARVCQIINKKVAYIMYKKGEHDISMFMFESKKVKFPKAKMIKINGKTFYLSQEKGYNMALWIDEGIACVVVSDLGEAELIHLASI